MPDEQLLWEIVKTLRLLATDIKSLGARTERGGNVSPLHTDVYSEPSRLGSLLEILDAFPTLVGYLNGRRGSAKATMVQSEADVQDVLYLALKPAFSDLVYEEPTKKGAAAYSIGDFSVPCLNLILEVKYVGSATDVKGKADEMCEDIWKYSTQSDCRRIVFFVYDPFLLIPDRANYTRALSAKAGEFSASGRLIEIQTIIKP